MQCTLPFFTSGEALPIVFINVRVSVLTLYVFPNKNEKSTLEMVNFQIFLSCYLLLNGYKNVNFKFLLEAKIWFLKYVV